MCLIIFSFKQNPDYPLIIAANRDEFYERKTRNIHLWEQSEIIGGQDLESGGTWMGINKTNKRVAAITNYRDPSLTKTKVKSRGFIVSSYLKTTDNNTEFIKKLQNDRNSYNGYNLIFGDINRLFYYSNIKNEIHEIEPGLHAVSNAFLNTPWPKVNDSKQQLSKAFTQKDIIQASLKALANNNTYPDETLPETGMGIEWERLLSPIFVKSEIYGTRSSSILLVDKDHNSVFTEKAFINDKITKLTTITVN